MRKVEDKSKEEIVKIGRKIGEAFAAEKAGIVTLLTEEAAESKKIYLLRYEALRREKIKARHFAVYNVI